MFLPRTPSTSFSDLPLPLAVVRRSQNQSWKAPRIRPADSRKVVGLLLLMLGAVLLLSEQSIAQSRGKVKRNSTATRESTQQAQAEQIRADMEYLASDELRGRGVGDDSIDVAADYLVERMEEIGLNTEAWQGSAKQPFEVLLGAQASNKNNNFIEIKNKNATEDTDRWELGDDLGPLAIGSAIGKQSGPLVFAGYGITAKDLEYDDYQGIETEGAIVIIIRKEPQRNDANSRFNGTENTRHALFDTKVKNAMDHGAAAVIIVNDQDSVQEAADKIEEEKLREQTRLTELSKQLASVPRINAVRRRQLRESKARVNNAIAALNQDITKARQGVLGMSEAGRRRPNRESIPVMSVARDVVNGWLEVFTNTTLSKLEKTIDETGKPNSLALQGSAASISVSIEPLNTETNNVLGFLEGKGSLAGETVIIGAHYDHVGMGGNGSLAPGTIAVHNGADDNASGTVAMLSVAKQVSERIAETPNHRRVVFMGFSAEERGLLGSKHYVKQPRFPLKSTVGMINLDMVGRLNDNELTVYGTGSGEGFDSLVDKVNSNQETPFKLFKMSSGYGPSDHQSFNEVGIPVLFFFTGIHNDYHRPSDDFDKINYGGLNRITNMVSDVAMDWATRESRPKFAETNRRVEIRRQMTAFLGVSLADTDGSILVGQVTAGGPAATAGLRSGDQILKVANRNVAASSEVIDWVRSQAPGNKAKIQIQRDGESMELTVELGKRPAQ